MTANATIETPPAVNDPNTAFVGISRHGEERTAEQILNIASQIGDVSVTEGGKTVGLIGDSDVQLPGRYMTVENDRGSRAPHGVTLTEVRDSTSINTRNHSLPLRRSVESTVKVVTVPTRADRSVATLTATDEKLMKYHKGVSLPISTKKARQQAARTFIAARRQQREVGKQ